MSSKAKLHTILFKYSLLFLVTLLVIYSCYREPINIDLSGFDNNIVIEGIITDQIGNNAVRITRTAKYNGEDEFPVVSGALVKIEDNLNNSVRLHESKAGVYRASLLKGIPGRTYTLTVICDGKIYTASSTMPQPLLLKTLNFESITPTNNAYKFSCSFKDRAGIRDYCLINIYTNGYLNDYYLYQDNITDGQEILLDNFDIVFIQNDIVTIDLLTLDQATYDYLRTLDIIYNSEDDEFVASLLPVTTFNPTTNLDNGALGYFSANTLRSYIKTFK